MRRLLFGLISILVPLSAFAQANGKLQIHYMNVGQGDGAVLISPLGEVVLFDDGVLNQCSGPIAYLASIGVTHVDYHIASHYHSDHIGCAPQMFQAFPLIKGAYDRGGSYGTTTFTNYVNAVGAKRVTAVKGKSLTLDAGSANPVIITFVVLNGNGTPTSDENDLSLVSVVHFGAFDAEFGGDLSGATTGVTDTDPNVPVTPPPTPSPTPGCAFSVAPTSISEGSGGGTASVSVTAGAGCAWTASSNASWIGISSGASGNGSGYASFNVAANTGSARSGSVTVAGQSVSISQAAVAASPVCCKVCTTGKPCGDTCIAASSTCHTAPGCACSAASAFDALVAAPTPQFLNYTPTQGPIAYSYADIESGVAGLVGQIEVYKVHHHGSATASNSSWMNTTTPKVAIISAGLGNQYGHPTQAALTRIHAVGTKTYWTTGGNGAAPIPGQDFIANDAIVVQAAPASASFTVTYSGTTDTYNDWGPAPSAPFGSFDAPGNGATIAGEVAVTGWAVDDSGIARVDIYRAPVSGEPNTPVFIGTATEVLGARSDVASVYPTYPGKDSSGWGYMLLSNFLPNAGSGTFTISAYATAVDGGSTLLGTKTIIGTNSIAKNPFGTIDTPAQGQVVSGTIINFGWALTPKPNAIPIDGSTITVFIDGLPVGHPDYGHPREDIQSLFPGYANTDTAVGFYVIDTTKLANGLHSIAWTVTDSAGNMSGIGSRFFTVSNQ